MDRRSFLRTTSFAAAGLALGGCAPRTTRWARPAPGGIRLAPVQVAWDRIIRTTVGLRPYRESGFLLRPERFDEKTVIHNFGHGGSGMSLSWGTAHLATELALEHPDRRVAVIGSGIVGLTSARILQRHGFDVTIYARELPPNTTSNMSWAGFTPNSSLARNRTPAWEAQFRRAVEIAYREHQLLVGRGFGVSWIDSYEPRDRLGASVASPFGGGDPNLPDSVETGIEWLQGDQNPFPTRYAIRQPTLRFEPSIYLDALTRDVLAWGGEIRVRGFDSPRDLMTLSERLIVNCTGLGSKDLFGDPELTPIKGQLTVLVPQPEVNYTTAGMLPRQDGIVLGHVMQRGVWSLDVDEDEQARVMANAFRVFGGFDTRAVAVGRRGEARPLANVPSSPPPVESFLSLRS